MSAPIVRVGDVMKKEVLSIDGMATASDAAAMMRTARVSELLVARRNDDDAWGMVTITDLVKKVIVPGLDGKDVSIYEIMTKPIITVPAKMDIRHAIRLMNRTSVRSAPVEDLGEVVGVVTLSSLVLDNNLL
ncbi:MAG: CBS domain-containing protein [Pseudodesulfovibrio sp.]|uniref:CBS domain containing protein n=1 Tax=Pseudodesulfovibrio aespoeensis (strain ATCC 700646 / DSM 10631 / Aspo-2) TaxID=643562 RepID=E6VS25_PSEA9|nr:MULTISPECIES: CBS domain-containing protein [Pseudodesulfovibrio]MBU4378716.1 CBS domain-containing protein [Pseudomonadota bacterium]ADU61958.1 CBS domain containing protein [Pseudodesulfovibrio aespoeensis Aspo-2]MBU4476798.1 CBS domain-containing protein [Pseudomonadota bacterium]MBU4516072.1 CBS domain-containing protein [Pseudomonadota bacterium]MBU4522042.1 CBS domain-containing protein [Pseudomonadota bacterium]